MLFYLLDTFTGNNQTNNVVESINGKLKHFIKINSKMHKCLESLLKYIDFLKSKYQYKNSIAKMRVTINNNLPKDPIITEIYATATSTIADWISNQYERSQAEYEVIDEEKDEEKSEIAISSKNDLYSIQNFNATPSVSYFGHNIMQLPCRHIFCVTIFKQKHRVM